eukprot:6183313-Pleurochrysis_carterae.AAC.7
MELTCTLCAMQVSLNNKIQRTATLVLTWHRCASTRLANAAASKDLIGRINDTLRRMKERGTPVNVACAPPVAEPGRGHAPCA